MSTRASPNRRDMTARWLAVMLMAAIVTPAGAAAVTDTEPGRDRIVADRHAAQARYEARLRACDGRFARTACEDKARAELRSAIEQLDAERAALDDAERRARAASRRAAQARRAQQQADAQARPPAAPAVSPRHPLAASSPIFGAHARPEAATHDRAAALARWHERQRRAKAHEDAVRQRNAERAARKPPAAGLPLPDASVPH